MTTLSLSLTIYQPFDHTKFIHSNLKDICRERSPSYLKTAKNVGLIALHIILLLPALILDAIYVVAKLLCGRCVKKAIPQPERMEKAPIRPPLPIPPKVPNAEERKRALASPFSALHEEIPIPRNDLGEVDSDRYLTQAVDVAYHYLPQEKAAYYRELLRFGGMNEAGDPGEIEVYLWIAECAILRYLLADRFDCPGYLTGYRDHSVDGRDSLEDLFLALDALLPEQKAALILQVYNPQIKWALQANTKRLFEFQIWGLAQHLSRNPDFLQSVRRVYPVE